ncbi:hypothetical protein [uncultured Fibrella sp.]|uniref:hypothetical protein n=1 Tax=uncultured Fibrella sp. TaxID=1284596 RepID=UPI0035CC0192
MKTAKLSIRFLAYGLCLAATLYNCKTKDVDSLTPFTYTFKGFDATLPTVTPTQPAAVSVTASSLTSSTATAAVSSGLTNLTATGQVPAVVQAAGAAVSSAVSTSKAAELAASFSPAVLANLTTSGTLPANLQAEAAALAANPALKAYLPTFSLPTVNGKPVGGRTSTGATTGLIEKIAATYLRADDDACKAAAAKAFADAVVVLDAGKTSQEATVNQAFATAQTSILGEVATCKSTVTTSYGSVRTNITQQFNQSIASLDAGKAVLGETLYNLLRVLYAVSYSQTLQTIATLQSADNNTCDAISTAKLAAATQAKTTDLNKITANYNATLATLTKARDQAVASCHNQGNGG